MKVMTLVALPFAMLASAPAIQAREACPTDASVGQVVETSAIDLAWSSTRVNFDLVTEGKDQVVAYYNATRNLTVAHRRTTTNQAFYGSVWSYKQLDTMLGWDNHNSAAVGISSDRHFHIMGNMHVDRLVYYKTEHPGEIRSLKRVEVMVDPALERRMTYPRFVRTDDGTLLFRFRVGGSWNGNEIYYRYDAATQTWSKILEQGFTDGEGEQNAYISNPVRGPDGKLHLAWVWRVEPGSTMNTMVSYARTADFINWEDAFGKRIALPIRLGNTPVAAPVPPGNGMINGHQKVGFDPQGQPLVTYFQYDEQQIAQAYIARFEGSGWKQYKLTELTKVTHMRDRRGRLSPTSVRVSSSPIANPDGTVSVDVVLMGKPKRLLLDGQTLELLATCDRGSFPAPLQNWHDVDDSQLGFRWMESGGKSANDDHRVFMTWHSRGGNRDRAFEDISAPSTLRVHVMKAPSKSGG